MGKKEKRAIKEAEHDALVAREKKLAAFRAGTLSYWEAEAVSAELCAAGDLERRREAEQLEKDKRELGARLRAGVI
jgi:hypothetical protein